jgi:hypothetical protein
MFAHRSLITDDDDQTDGTGTRSSFSMTSNRITDCKEIAPSDVIELRNSLGLDLRTEHDCMPQASTASKRQLSM